MKSLDYKQILSYSVTFLIIVTGVVVGNYLFAKMVKKDNSELSK
jgi:hypothetical protein